MSEIAVSSGGFFFAGPKRASFLYFGKCRLGVLLLSISGEGRSENLGGQVVIL